MYGFLISLGIFIAAFSAEKLAENRKMNVKFLWDSLFGSVVYGIIGARIYHVVGMWEYYAQNPLDIIKIWRGGLGIFGAILGGVSYFIYIAKKQNEPILKWLDIAGLFFPLAQAIGRLGNFFNQELYGKPTGLPWGVYIKPENRLTEVILYEKFHPLFFYEASLNILLFFLLLKLTQKRLKDGAIFFIYLIGYGLIRFLTEFLKIDSWKIYGLNVAQSISILTIATATFLLWKTTRKEKIKDEDILSI
jgi:phosphatidylglycerol---prolipoprotein diacylglyceryl transferase